LTNAARAVILKVAYFGGSIVMRPLALLVVLFLVSAGALISQENAAPLQSGLKVGEVLPGPFDAFNINGTKGKGRQHCLVCEFGLNPVVMVFAKEPTEGKDGPLVALLAKLDEAVSRHADKDSLASAVIFLSPDARNSANNAGEQDPKKLVEEALARDALIERLKPRADKLKNVIVAFFPEEGPKDCRINPKADVTVFFYEKHKLLANFAFGEGQMTSADVDRIITTVDEILAKKKS
jgi:hypothetical protein